ncbi:FK506-binding protein 15 [Nematolebias whitei]|uniref:FK506-binding protein 15 n=1 Tax=Nematolebias whitei TaxID=451745 RepID=UPI001897CFD7|nr:FK506-binding protein 15 [Nematolebias whitei]
MPHLGDKLRASVRDDVRRDTMESKNMEGEEVGGFQGRGELREGNKMSGLQKTVNNGEDGLVAVRRGKAGYKIEGDLAVAHVVVAFCLGETPREEGAGMDLIVLRRLLGKDRSYPSVGGVHLQDELVHRVHLTEELALSTARVSQLQLEATAHQMKAAELQNILSSALQDSESHGQHTAVLETQLEELKEAAERAQTLFRSEKQRRKEMELKVSTVEEELQDLKTDKDNLERALMERKKKWQAERKQRDEDLEELRKSSQQELDNLRAQLRKARTSSDKTASEQLSQLQAELEEEWKKKSEHMLASAKEQHRRQLAEATEQREVLQDKFTQIQGKLNVLKQSRETEEQSLLQHRRQREELQALQDKYLALEQQGTAVREKLEGRVAELQRKVEKSESSRDAAAEVKRVMNGVFHSLRAEFELSESYSGQAVLGVIVATIKNVTLNLLSGTERSLHRPAAKENKEEPEDVKQSEDGSHHVHANGKREVREEEEEEEHVADSDWHGVSEAQMIEEVKDEEEEAVMESETPGQAEASQVDDPQPALTSHLPAHNTKTAGGPDQLSSPDPATEDRVSTSSMDPDDGPEKCPQVEGGQEAHGAVSSEGDMKSLEETQNVEEKSASSQRAFGPPVNPPPPPSAPENSSEEDTSLTGEVGEENGEEPFLQTPPPAKAPAASSEEEEEDELSLKGRPPPTPLFGDDEDDDDLDWLN